MSTYLHGGLRMFGTKNQAVIQEKEEKIEELEREIAKLKDAIAKDDTEAMKKGTEDLTQALYKLSEKIYQAAGEYASTFAITSLQVSGSFGTKTDKVEVPWNNKVNLNNSDTDVVIVVSEQ